MLTDQPAGSRVMIVLENGSEWPGWLEELGASEQTSVIAQADHESLARFEARVTKCLDALDTKFELVAIGCSERTDPSALAARKAMARALLQQRPGRLLLTASERSGGRSRHCLSGFAVDLSTDFESAGVCVGIRFGGLGQVS